MNQPAISPKLTDARQRLKDKLASLGAPRFTVGDSVLVRGLIAGEIPATFKARIEAIEPGDSFAEVRFFKVDDEANPTGHASLVCFDEMYHAA